MIRKAVVSDIPSIQAVARIAWEDTYRDIMKPETRSQFLDEFYSFEALSKALVVPKGGIWVADQDGQVVGFAQVIPMLNKPGLELTRLYVLPDKQRKGVGRSLLDVVLSILQDAPLWALVEKDDGPAVAFYIKNGFMQKRELTLNLYGEDLRFIEFCYKPVK